MSDGSKSNGDVVQLVRTPACHVGGRGFEPRRPRHSFLTSSTESGLCFLALVHTRSMTPAQPPKVQLSNTPDYRENYANSVQIRVNIWDFFLMFGMINQSSPDTVNIQSFQGIYLSPQQAKALLNVLATEHYAIRGGLRRNPAGGARDERNVAVVGSH